MSLSTFQYDKSWLNAGDFPTYESSEEQVRQDMQYLFDRILGYLNAHISELYAANLPFTATAAVDKTNVQEAIENVQAQIAEASQGAVPDGSITAAKLCSVEGLEAVTTAGIRHGAVSTAKLADSAVSTAKLADGAVTAEKIGSVPLSAFTGTIDLQTQTVNTLPLSRLPDVSSLVSALDAAVISSGTLSADRIPALAADKLASGTVDLARLPDVSSLVSSLAASVISSGEFDSARIPGLAASKISSGTLDEARLPDIAAEKIAAANKVAMEVTFEDDPDNPVTYYILQATPVEEPEEEPVEE